MDLLLLFSVLIGAVISIFVIVNPLSTAIIFLQLTANDSVKEKKAIARSATTTAFIILMFFALTGFIIFEFFSITVGSFKIMGGIFLFRTAWLMLQGEGKTLHASHLHRDITLVPLAIPLISGPGTIVTSVVLFQHANSLLEKSLIILAIALVMLLTYLILLKSHWVKMVLRDKGIRVLNKLMGIILGSIAVQFVINGIKDTIPILMQ